MGKAYTVEPLLLTLAQAAEMAGCDEIYLHRLHAAGKIQIVQASKSMVRVRTQSLRDYLASKAAAQSERARPKPKATSPLHAKADRAATASICYFIGGDDGPIKIGHSVNPAFRLASIQTGAAFPLRILATRTGGVLRERAYHAQFQDSRMHGEWFARDRSILAEINRLNKRVG